MNQPPFILLPEGREVASAWGPTGADETLQEDATTLLARAASDAAVTVGHLTGAVVGAWTAPLAMAAAASEAARNADADV